MVLYNGQEYQDNDFVDWDTAIAVGGLYFQQAKRLGLPMPPACFVFIDDYSRDSKQNVIVGWYALLLQAAELDSIFFRKEKKWQEAGLVAVE
ncbi:MAG: hypothetical protein PHQ03_04675 [Methylococcales bacterium]|nr:hypothetical protein [Methylococcales bacterium]